MTGSLFVDLRLQKEAEDQWTVLLSRLISLDGSLTVDGFRSAVRDITAKLTVLSTVVTDLVDAVDVLEMDPTKREFCTECLQLSFDLFAQDVVSNTESASTLRALKRLLAPHRARLMCSLASEVIDFIRCGDVDFFCHKIEELVDHCQQCDDHEFGVCGSFLVDHFHMIGPGLRQVCMAVFRRRTSYVLPESTSIEKLLSSFKRRMLYSSSFHALTFRLVKGTPPVEFSVLDIALSFILMERITYRDAMLQLAADSFIGNELLVDAFFSLSFATEDRVLDYAIQVFKTVVEKDHQQCALKLLVSLSARQQRIAARCLSICFALSRHSLLAASVATLPDHVLIALEQVFIDFVYALSGAESLDDLRSFSVACCRVAKFPECRSLRSALHIFLRKQVTVNHHSLLIVALVLVAYLFEQDILGDDDLASYVWSAVESSEHRTVVPLLLVVPSCWHRLSSRTIQHTLVSIVEPVISSMTSNVPPFYLVEKIENSESLLALCLALDVRAINQPLDVNRMMTLLTETNCGHLLTPESGTAADIMDCLRKATDASIFLYLQCFVCLMSRAVSGSSSVPFRVWADRLFESLNLLEHYIERFDISLLSHMKSKSFELASLHAITKCINLSFNAVKLAHSVARSKVKCLLSSSYAQSPIWAMHVFNGILNAVDERACGFSLCLEFIRTTFPAHLDECFKVPTMMRPVPVWSAASSLTAFPSLYESLAGLTDVSFEWILRYAVTNKCPTALCTLVKIVRALRTECNGKEASVIMRSGFLPRILTMLNLHEWHALPCLTVCASLLALRHAFWNTAFAPEIGKLALFLCSAPQSLLSTEDLANNGYLAVRQEVRNSPWDGGDVSASFAMSVLFFCTPPATCMAAIERIANILGSPCSYSEIDYCVLDSSREKNQLAFLRTAAVILRSRSSPSEVLTVVGGIIAVLLDILPQLPDLSRKNHRVAPAALIRSICNICKIRTHISDGVLQFLLHAAAFAYNVMQASGVSDVSSAPPRKKRKKAASVEQTGQGAKLAVQRRSIEASLRKQLFEAWKLGRDKDQLFEDFIEDSASLIIPEDIRTKTVEFHVRAAESGRRLKTYIEAEFASASGIAKLTGRMDELSLEWEQLDINHMREHFLHDAPSSWYGSSLFSTIAPQPSSSYSVSSKWHGEDSSSEIDNNGFVEDDTVQPEYLLQLPPEDDEDDQDFRFRKSP